MLLGPIVDAPVEEWDRMIALNLQGLLYVAHAALPHLLSAAEREPRRVADLVNVSSVAGRRVGAGGGIYQLTKHGVGVFSEALRQEVTGAPRALVAGRAGRDRERARHPRPRRRSATSSRPASAQILARRGHRRRDPLHRHATAARGDQRDPGPPDRAGALTAQQAASAAA